MSGNQRVALIVAAVAVAVVAFLALNPGDDEDETASTGTTAQRVEGTNTEGAPPAGTEEEPATETEPEPEPEPEIALVRLRDGKPVGGIQEIEVKSGEQIRIDVSADAPAHIHLHGYDVFRDAAPESPARFRLKAKLEGIFEIEEENTRVQIAELRVEP